MTLSLAQLKSYPSSRKKRRRLGRGNAGKGGTYGSRGQKGQNSRSGGKGKGGHRGKKSPAFISQIPKTRGFLGFNSKMSIVNIGQLNSHFSEGEVINSKKLVSVGLISKNGNGVKVLGGGELNKKFAVTAEHFSKSADNDINKAG